MNFNFESLKSGFTQYLEKLSEEKPRKHYNTDDENVSIFMYSNEFKDYLEDELNYKTNSDIISMTDLMDMVLVDGQLVDKDSDIAKEAGETQTLAEMEAQSEKDERAAEADAAEDTPETAKETTEGEVSVDATKNYAEESGTNIEDPEIVTGVLNDLLKDDKFKEVVDQDGDGEIKDEELAKFLDIVKCYDTEEDNLSLDDLIAAANDINEGVFRYKTDEETIEEIGETPNADEAGIGITSPRNSDGSYSSNFSVPVEQPKVDENGIPILKNMTEEERQQTIKEAQDDIKTKENELNSIVNNKDESVKGLKEAADKAYEEYQNAIKEIDEEKAKELDIQKTKVDEIQQNIYEQEQAITLSEQKESAAQTDYNSAKSNREKLESQLSELKSSNSDNAKEQVSALEAEVESAKKAEEEAKAALDEAKEETKAAQEKKAELEEQLEQEQTKLDELEKFFENSPEVKEKQEAWEEAQKAYTEGKEKATETAKTNLQQAQEKLNNLNSQESELEANKTLSQYSGANGELANFALQFEGNSESAMESICGYNLPDGLWCAAFVNYCVTQTMGENKPSWYQNCNVNSCSDVLAAANKNGAAFTDVESAQPGDLIIFNTSRGAARHIGIVTSVDPDGTVHTIEGNTSSKVGQRTYNGHDKSRVNSFVRLK